LSALEIDPDPRATGVPKKNVYLKIEEATMILVTGATGNTGAELIKQLSRFGAAVRAMTRRPRERTDETPPGVEFVTADFEDRASLRRALDGVDSAFLVTNSSERVQDQQLSFVDAARASSVRHIVYVSQLHAKRDSPVRFLRYHAVVEDAIASSEIAFTNLRPNLYMQGLFAYRSLIASEGRFFAPAVDSRVSIVDIRDIAAVAAAALTQAGHEGKTYDITGPEALTHAEMASKLSDALGRHITFVDIPEAAMRDALLGFGVPEWQSDGVIEDYAHYRRGEASMVSASVRDVTGHPPHSFADFARDYKRVFLH
jgi:uncharacterized protein YbjT (DUF2867 family)